MAKVKSPLLSLGASGQIAKSIVFSTWKGIADVRQYVVPANPKSAGQVTQRGFMASAVSLWHSTTRNVLDAAAFNIRAALESKPMSGFNVFCKLAIAALTDEDTIIVPWDFTVVSNSGGDLELSVELSADKVCKYQIGLKPNVLGEAVALGLPAAGTLVEFDVEHLVVGVDYYIKFSTAVADTQVVSGIYKLRTLD